jgi:hypothetical protein
MELRAGGVALMMGLIVRHEEGVFHGCLRNGEEGSSGAKLRYGRREPALCFWTISSRLR